MTYPRFPDLFACRREHEVCADKTVYCPKERNVAIPTSPRPSEKCSVRMNVSKDFLPSLGSLDFRVPMIVPV